jgi:hypothetical protein
MGAEDIKRLARVLEKVGRALWAYQTGEPTRGVCCDGEVLVSGAHRCSELADSLAVKADLDRVGALVLAA